MRWKLLIAASLLAAAGGLTSYFAAAYTLFALRANPSPLGETLLPLAPLGVITFASIFVYRHTPRRRALQAALTAVFASLLTLATLFAVFVILARAD